MPGIAFSSPFTENCPFASTFGKINKYWQILENYKINFSLFQDMLGSGQQCYEMFPEDFSVADNMCFYRLIKGLRIPSNPNFCFRMLLIWKMIADVDRGVIASLLLQHSEGKILNWFE